MPLIVLEVCRRLEELFNSGFHIAKETSESRHSIPASEATKYFLWQCVFVRSLESFLSEASFATREVSDSRMLVGPLPLALLASLCVWRPLPALGIDPAAALDLALSLRGLGWRNVTFVGFGEGPTYRTGERIPKK